MTERHAFDFLLFILTQLALALHHMFKISENNSKLSV